MMPTDELLKKAETWRIEMPPTPNWEITLGAGELVHARIHLKRPPNWLQRLMWRLAFNLVFKRI